MKFFLSYLEYMKLNTKALQLAGKRNNKESRAQGGRA